MTQLPDPEFLKSEIDGLIGPEKPITFLAGAGISMNPPSSLPSARLLCKTLFDFLGPLKDFEDLYSIKELRYEMIMERIKEYFDPGLEFLDYLALMDLPNYIHLFLAACIIRGMNVITTNFDFLIEWGLKFLLPVEKYTDVMPVITEQDFLAVQDEIVSETSTTSGYGRYFLFKIHGCKKNAFTDEDTSASIITTISALGKNRNKEKTFGLEPFKEPTISKLLSKHVLVVMGYSGNDDFDMTPVLANVADLESLIWIEHVQDGGTKIIQFDTTTPSETNPFLYKLKQAHEYDIILVKTRTDEFVRDILVPRFVPDLASRIESIYNQQVFIHEGIVVLSFEEWLTKSFKVPEPALSLKFAASLYFDSGHVDRALPACQTGKSVLDEEFASGKLAGERKEQYERLRHWFLNQLGLICIKNGLVDDATQYFHVAIQNAKGEDNLAEEADSSNNLAVALMDLDEAEAAEQYLDAALQIDLQLQDEKHTGHVLATSGELHRLKGDLQGAMHAFDESINHASKAGDLEGKCLSMARLGAIYAEMEDATRALPILEEAASISRSLGSLPLQLESFTPLLRLYKSGAVPSEDVDTLSRKVDALNEELGVTQAEARRQYHLADSLFKTDKREIGVTHLVTSLETAEKAGDKEYMIKACKGIAYYHRNRLDWDQAREYFEKLVEIARTIDDKDLEREALYNVGFVHENLKVWDEAFPMYEAVLALAQEASDAQMIADCYARMASVRYSQGLDDAAISLQRLAVEASSRAGGPTGLPRAKSQLEFYINNPSSRFARSN
jgi:tetratricopeptide (TPR) repeat protein